MKPPSQLSEKVKSHIRSSVIAMEDHAKESIAIILRDKTTQNGYGTLLAFLGNVKEPLPRNLYLATLVHYGYSYITALQVADIYDDRAGFFAAMSMIEESLSSKNSQ